MKRMIASRGERVSHWHAALCVLLVGLMLYNPFAGACNPNEGLSYDHLARNRATVGASELQHFSPVSNSTSHGELDVDVPAAVHRQPVGVAFCHLGAQVAFRPQPSLLTEFWNKPPPSL